MILRRAEYSDRNNIRSLIRLCGIGDELATDWQNYVLALTQPPGPIIAGCAALDYVTCQFCKGRADACPTCNYCNGHANDYAVLVNVATHISFRKQGVASKLIELLLDVARADGVQQVALCTMFYTFKFFQHRGWVNVKRQNLPAIFANYHQFTEQRYKKCGCMIRALDHGNLLDTVSSP